MPQGLEILFATFRKKRGARLCCEKDLDRVKAGKRQTYRKLGDQANNIAVKDRIGTNFFQNIIAISSVAKR